MSNKQDKKVQAGPRGPMHGIGKVEKAKDFKGTLKRLIKYSKEYMLLVSIVVIFLVVGIVASTTAPKILGQATTSLAESIFSKMAYENVGQMTESLGDNAKDMLGEDATIQTLIDNNMIPEEMLSQIPEEYTDISIFEEPKFDYEYILQIILIVAAIYIVSAIFSYIATRVMGSVAYKITYKLRKEVDEKLDRLPLRFYDEKNVGEIQSRISNDIDNIGTMLSQNLVQILRSIFTVISILIFMISISVLMTSVAIIVLPVSGIIIALIVKSSQKYFAENQAVLGKLNSKVEETFSGDLIVKAFNKQEKEIQEFSKLNNGIEKASIKSQFFSSLMMPIVQSINSLGYIGVCIIGAKLSIDGTISIGDIQAFLQYTNQFSQPLAQIANMGSSIQMMVASAERIFEILDEKEENVLKSYESIDNVQGDVEFKNVYFSYDKDVKLIDDFNLKVNKGDTIAIVGHTGSGKTTMINLLMKFYDIDSGDIIIDGKSTNNLSRSNVRDMFEAVLQDTWLFNGSIKENIRYGKLDATDEEVIKACKLAYADHFINTLPNGYDFVINETSDNISSGQKQLLTIARALLANKPMLILDEATSNVDTRTEGLLQKGIDELMHGKTSFVIAHRLSTIKNADKIILMEFGKIVEQGTHEELLALNGKYTKLYNSQFYNG